MASASRAELVRAVLDRYPRTDAEELGVRTLGTASALYRQLVMALLMALLMSARIRAPIALDAARALFRQRWTTARRMADACWEDRARVLNQAGYARYDERTSTTLGDTSELLLERYRGDLRRLRESAGRDPCAERRLLKEFKGVGDVGVDISFREAQRSWTELYPFTDRRALAAADRLGLGRDAQALAKRAEGDEFARLVSGLVRVDLDGAYDEIRARVTATRREGARRQQ